MKTDPINICPHCGEKYDERRLDRCPNAKSPDIGACWICFHGDGESDDSMKFDMEFDTYYHPECLPAAVDNILEYESSDTDN